MQALIIDNYDSFTFNLYQLVGQITGMPPTVVRNDSLPWEDLLRLRFDCVIVSPGPGRPDRDLDFGLSRRAILDLNVPLLGVCLGHQGICHAFGGSIIYAPEPMHGHLSSIYHQHSRLFAGLPNPFPAVRYHSLVCAQPLPPSLESTAWTIDGIVMALAHRTRPLWGVQFHPESISTEHGRTILANFVDLAQQFCKVEIARPLPPPPPRPAPTSQKIHCFVRRCPLKIDTAHLFAALYSRQDYAFWLDSSLRSQNGARFSFMGGESANTAETLRYYTAEKKLIVQHGSNLETSADDVLAYLDRRLRELHLTTDLPFDFNCGYVGYFGYELKSLCGGSLAHRSADPDCFLLFAGKCIAIDHQSNEAYLLYTGPESASHLASEWFDSIVPYLDGVHPDLTGSWNQPDICFNPSRNRDTYLAHIAKCLECIRDGESYEICLTNQFRAGTTGDPLTFYRALRQANPAPYSAFLKFPGISVACSSPERFLKISPEGNVNSKPIKGTMRRSTDAAEDDYLRQRLRLDIKSHAENLMIVDLLRNDLGSVCEIGSVTVSELMQVETYANVHQLVSTITGQLAPGRTAADCFRAAFPGGSMTGAPKLRTMSIIDSLEREARGIYSGSLGYFALNGSADLNIVIRSAVFSGSRVSIGAGGAIVAMSDPSEEWREILLKAESVLSAFRNLAHI